MSAELCLQQLVRCIDATWQSLWQVYISKTIQAVTNGVDHLFAASPVHVRANSRADLLSTHRLHASQQQCL